MRLTLAKMMVPLLIEFFEKTYNAVESAATKPHPLHKTGYPKNWIPDCETCSDQCILEKGGVKPWEEWGYHHDHHFRPQALYCGAYKGVPFDHVVMYNATHLFDTIKAFLKEAGLPEKFLYGWGADGKQDLSMNRDVPKAAATEQTAEASSKTVHGTPEGVDPREWVTLQNRDTTAGMSLKDSVKSIFTRDLAIRFERLFKIDYDSFPGMPFVRAADIFAETDP